MAKQATREQLIAQLHDLSKGDGKKVALYWGQKTGKIPGSKVGENLRKKFKSMEEHQGLSFLRRELYKGYDGQIQTLTSQIYLAITSLPLEYLEKEQAREISRFYEKFLGILNDASKQPRGIEPIEHIKALKAMQVSLETLKPYYEEMAELKFFGPNQYSEDILHFGLSATRDIDMELVRAFAYIGTPLKQDEHGKWIIDEQSNGNGFMFKDKNGRDQTFTLPRESVQAFLDGYLNNHSNRNGKVITPKGLFRFYLESLPNYSNFAELPSEEKKSLTSRANSEFSSENLIWKSFLVIDDITARSDATRLALADIYQSQFVDRQDIPSDLFEGELRESIDDNDLVPADILDDMMHSALQIHEHVIDQTSAYESTEDIIEKYQKEQVKLSMALQGTQSPQYKASIQKRIDDLTKTMATLIAVREFELGLAEIAKKSVESEYGDQRLISSKTKEQTLADRIHSFISRSGDLSFIHVDQKDGKWELTIDETVFQPNPENFNQYMYFDENVSEEVRSMFTQLQSRFDSIVSYKIVNGFDARYELTEEEQMSIATEDLYDIMHDYALDENLLQILNDEAIYDRTCAVLDPKAPDNVIKNIYDMIIRECPDGDPTPIIDRLRKEGKIEEGTDLDNYIFTAESIARYRHKDNPEDSRNKTAESRLLTTYVIMDRLGKAINKDPELLRLIEQQGPSNPEVQRKLVPLFNQARDSIKQNPPTEEEVKRAKFKYHTLNKAKNYAKVKSMEDKPAIIDGTVQEILDDREKKLLGQYAREVQEERARQFEGQDQDAEVEQEEKKYEKYTFKDKYGKKDGSDTLAKLKPYCKKTSVKIIDDILKMIDKTVIISEVKSKDKAGIATTAVPDSEAASTVASESDPSNPEIVSTDDEGVIADASVEEEQGKKPDEHSTDGEDPKKTPEGDSSTEDLSIEELSAEITRHGKYAYLVSGRLMNRSVSTAKWGQNAPNSDELKGIQSLIKVLDFIGSPERDKNEALLKLGLLREIEKTVQLGTKDTELSMEMYALANGLEDKELTDAIISFMQEKDPIHLLWALELTSDLKHEGGESKLELESKLTPELIAKIQESPDRIDEILKESGMYDYQQMAKVSKIWADAVIPVGISDMLGKMKKDPSMSREVDEAINMQRRVDEMTPDM